jgi:hypothetical protein
MTQGGFVSPTEGRGDPRAGLGILRNPDRPLDLAEGFGAVATEPFRVVAAEPFRPDFTALGIVPPLRGGSGGFDPAGFDAAGFDVGTVAAPGIVVRNRNRPMDVS